MKTKGMHLYFTLVVSAEPLEGSPPVFRNGAGEDITAPLCHLEDKTLAGLQSGMLHQVADLFHSVSLDRGGETEKKIDLKPK